MMLVDSSTHHRLDFQVGWTHWQYPISFHFHRHGSDYPRLGKDTTLPVRGQGPQEDPSCIDRSEGKEKGQVSLKGDGILQKGYLKVIIKFDGNLMKMARAYIELESIYSVQVI